MTNDELYELVRDNYNKVNKGYLEEQIQKAIGNVPISCFKCHGTGVYGVPYLDDNGGWDGRLGVRKCEVCGHTGKITLALYEKWQKRMRVDKE